MNKTRRSAATVALVALATTVLLANGVSLNPFGTSSGNTADLRFLELAANGTNYVGFKAPDAIASNLVWVLPPADGTSGQMLQTNGSATLSWADAGRGAWAAVSYSSGNFAGNNDMTWSVDSADQTTFAYSLSGKTMVVAFTLQSTTVGGTPSTSLLITIPASKTAARAIWQPVRIKNGGSTSVGACYVDGGSTLITCRLINDGTYSSGTNNTDVTGEMTFEVQ